MKRIQPIFLFYFLLIIGQTSAQGRLIFLGETWPVTRSSEKKTTHFFLQEKSRRILSETNLAYSLLLRPFTTGAWSFRPISFSRKKDTSFPSVKHQKTHYATTMLLHVEEFELKSLGNLPSDLNFIIASRLPKKRDFSVVFLGEKTAVISPQWKVLDQQTSIGPVKIDLLDLKNSVQLISTSYSTRTWSFLPRLWEYFSQESIFSGQDFSLKSLDFLPVSFEQPLISDAASFLQSDISSWRNPEREFFIWDEHPDILILMTKDGAVQSRYLKRLAFFVEKWGYRGRLLTNKELKNLRGWNAHDYSCSSLAQFFTLAHRTRFELNTEEVELREQLVQNGLLIPHLEGWLAGTGALLGLHQNVSFDVKKLLFTHEAFHGFYFQNTDFRHIAKKVWKNLSVLAQDTFILFLRSLQYDVQWSELVINEFQAYCLQQHPDDWEIFFKQKVLAKVEQTFSQKQVSDVYKEFLHAAWKLDQAVQKLFRVSSGRVISLN